MFIIWGEKQATRKMGFVAENCPTCRTTQAVRLLRVGLAPHLFWIPFGKGQLIGYYGVCEACGTQLDVGPTDYVSLSKKRIDDLSELVRLTNPKLDPANREAIASHDRFRSIRDPLLLAEHTLQQRGSGGMRFDKASGLALLATIAIPLIIFSLDLSFLGPAAQEAVGSLGFWIFVAGIAVTGTLLYREPHRFFRRELEPEIIKSLGTVNPRSDELEDCLERIRKYEYKVSGHVSAKRLLEQLQASRFSFQ
jgi:hypothetical protein